MAGYLSRNHPESRSNVTAGKRYLLNALADKKLQQHDISLTYWETAADRANQHVTIGFRGEDIGP